MRIFKLLTDTVIEGQTSKTSEGRSTKIDERPMVEEAPPVKSLSQMQWYPPITSYVVFSGAITQYVKSG